jgi:hypothetical protein
VELAIIVPVFLLIVAFAVDFGRLFYAYVAVSNAAKEGAAYGAQNPICVDATVAGGTLCPDPSNVTWRVQNEASNLVLTPTSIVCLARDTGAVRSPMTMCEPEDTYVVVAEHEFRLVTPIVGDIVGTELTLRSEARARVLNLAFDPTPGASIEKRACFGTGCDPVDTPLFDGTENLYQEGLSGETLTYSLRVVNIGGERLTSMTIADSAGALPFGTASCPAFPAAMNVRDVWQCTYTRTAPSPGGPSEMLYTNTATVDAAQIAPRQAQATVRIIASPAALQITKHVHVYQEGGTGKGPAFGNATTWDAYRNSQIGAVEMWFRITVSNTGGQDAAGFTLSDESGALPVNLDCPTRPTTLGPGQTYTCRFSRTYTANGSVLEMATASATNVSSVNASTTVNVQACATPLLVIPKLVGLTKSNAETAWTAAGFPLTQLTRWNGQPNAIVGTQSVTAYACVPANQTMTVTQ